MPENIGIVQCKLIGISCLEDGERQRVMNEWNARFHEHQAFWIDAKQGQTAPAIAQDIADMSRSQGIAAIGGQSLVLAVFLDLTKAPNEELLREIMKIPRILNTALDCMIPLTLEFGYLAVRAFGDTTAMKDNVQKVVNINCEDRNYRKQLFLVATSPLWQRDEDISWKSVMVCLDLLRRNSAPASMVPAEGGNPCNNVGFLRYGEYDEERINRLAAQKARIKHELSDYGTMELSNLINMALGKIEQDVEENFPVEGNSHPIHPGMYPVGMIAVGKAKHGREPFASARSSTSHALDMTGKQLTAMIQEAYQDQIANAADYLKQIMQEADIGIELERDASRMLSILDVEPLKVSNPMLPSLNYLPTGYATEIENYLKSVRRCAAAKCRNKFAKALVEAYNQVPDSEYTQRKAALQQELQNVMNKQNMLMTKTQLINDAAMGNVLPGTAFSVIIAAGKSSFWAVCRDEKIGMELDNALRGSRTRGFLINATSGGLKKLDNAPLKALQLLQFDCNEASLNDLIG